MGMDQNPANDTGFRNETGGKWMFIPQECRNVASFVYKQAVIKVKVLKLVSPFLKKHPCLSGHTICAMVKRWYV